MNCAYCGLSAGDDSDVCLDCEEFFEPDPEDEEEVGRNDD